VHFSNEKKARTLQRRKKNDVYENQRQELTATVVVVIVLTCNILVLVLVLFYVLVSGIYGMVLLCMYWS